MIVTGILLPLAVGTSVKVVQLTFGQVPVRFRTLSKGPVGPDSHRQEMLRLPRLSWQGSESRYCLSPQAPRKYSQAVGAPSIPMKVPLPFARPSTGRGLPSAVVGEVVFAE